MPGPTNHFVPAGASPLFGDVPVSEILDLADKPAKKPTDAATEFELNIINLASESATAVAANVSPYSRVLKIIVLGGKVLKLVFGTADEGGPNQIFGVMDEAFLPIPDLAGGKLKEIVDKAKNQFTAAGWVVMEPVWLKDPKVGE